MKNRGLSFRFDCGREDGFYADNLALHEQLLDLGIEHQFETFAGAHTWDYWRQNLPRTLKFFLSKGD